MTKAQDTLEELERFRKLQQQHLDLVLALTRANGDLLKARQRASGIEFDVLTAERHHAEGTQKDIGDVALNKMYAQDAAAKQTLAAAEDIIADLEQRLSEITRNMALPERDSA